MVATTPSFSLLRAAPASVRLDTMLSSLFKSPFFSIPLTMAVPILPQPINPAFIITSHLLSSDIYVLQKGSRSQPLLSVSARSQDVPPPSVWRWQTTAPLPHSARDACTAF